ncbi:centrosomal protein of 55 kDa-like isoform X2 [Littorina saxatilis]
MRGEGVSVCGPQEGKMECELSAYRRKVDQMTVLLKHYQTELESHKVRRDGVETVSRLLAEARQENALLKRNQVALETTVKNLQNRLTVNGVTSLPGTEDNEVIVPGTSTQTLTKLAVENKRLRSLLQKDTGSEINDDSLRKQSITEDPDLVERLEAENKSMKMKLSDLEALFKASNNDKDRQLAEFKDQLEQHRAGTGSGSGQTGLHGLKEHLHTFMSHCQHLEAQLNQAQVEQSTAPATGESTIQLKPVAKQAVERTDSVDGVDSRQLLEEKQKLQDRVEEVTKMNQRWQEFFNERDRYTQSLEQKVKDLEERLKQAMRSGPTEEFNRRIEQVLEKSQKEQQQVEDMRRKAEEEVAQLRQEVLTRDAHVYQLESQVNILSRSVKQHGPTEMGATIEHLKAQIQVCTEDFEKERQDRQVALQKVASLQDQVVRLNKLNTSLQTLVCNQVGQAPRSSSQEHSQYGHHDPNTLQPRGGHYQYPHSTLDYDGPASPPSNDNWRDFPNFDYELPNRVQGVLAPGHTSMPGTTVELVARGSNSKPKHSLSDSALGGDGRKQENVLTCPKCNKEFCEERQGELLAHMDVCWE